MHGETDFQRLLRERTRPPEPDGEAPALFRPVEPEHDFDRLILPEATREQLMLAIETMRRREQLFDHWGLRMIEPHPNTAISLHGPSGTGKTMAAHAIARRLGKRIILADYTQLESKYHGDGTRNLHALFAAARQHDAVLFLDEADTLLHRRFEATSQGSEHAVNTLRGALLMALDAFEGLVVFATNSASSYDPAVHTRVRHIQIPLPDAPAREAIWRAHLPPRLPLAPDVCCTTLARMDGVSGREIKKAVIEAATRALCAGRPHVTQADFRTSLESARTARRAAQAPSPHPAPPDLAEAVLDAAAGAEPQPPAADEPEPSQ
ncbi:ATP-binding protein [Planobispora takensis]|uniref:AAA+ ATPase domain-containing protein n=1 Tax=Planobispora takensis TaxID=1367882 RepID=A0A8J3T385_9ACTN|nr:ATP-binding protein [Planobispora takensis]GII04407.1 hypothetical protein Pta02_64150 [Planobispora takensis]